MRPTAAAKAAASRCGLNWRITGKQLTICCLVTNGTIFIGLSSYYNTIGSGEFVIDDVAGVAGVGGLKDEDFRFGLGHGAMLDAARDNTELAGQQFDGVVAKFDFHLAAPNE